MYNLTLGNRKIPVDIIQDVQNLFLMYESINKETQQTGDIVLGFDTEFSHNEIQIISIATVNHIYIVRIKYLTYFTHHISYLSNIIESRSFLKTGANIENDMMLLRKQYSFNPVSYIDLQSLAVSQKFSDISLEALAKRFLPEGFRKKSIHNGNWVGELTHDQIEYAAIDAYLSYMLYWPLIGKIWPEMSIPIDLDQIDELEYQLMKTWLMRIIDNLSGPRSINSIINQIIHSYGPWVTKYIESDRRKMASRIIEKLIINKELNIDRLRQEILPSTRRNNDSFDEKIIFSDDDFVYIWKNLNGMKLQSAINKMANSYQRLSNKRINERLEYIRELFDKLHQDGRIILSNVDNRIIVCEK